MPYTEPRLLDGSGTATASPFVIAIENAGIKVLPSIANAVFLIAAWSAGNSDIYASSRTFYALALEGQVPRIFRRCTKRGLPIYCVAVTGIFALLGGSCFEVCDQRVMSPGYLNTGGKAAVTAFNWLYNISAITGIITWWQVDASIGMMRV